MTKETSLPAKQRIWELDALRGLCILCMVAIHAFWDLSAFGMTGRQCQTTIANGKLLMKDRELIGIDEEAVNAHILEESKKLWGALNDCTY